MISEKGIRELEVFNTLEAFKRREIKLVKQSAFCMLIAASTMIASNAILPESIGIVPAAAVVIPTAIIAVKKGIEADKISSHADKIFKDNKDIIMDYKLNGIDEINEYKNKYPSLSKKFMPINTYRK